MVNKRELVNRVKKNKKNAKRAFTLIELLAVIIILGVLMIIAIPSLTDYIQTSRKDSYITTADQYINGARTKVNSSEIPMFDVDTTYYLPASCISLEKGGSSPFGEWEEAYIVVTYDGHGYDYYWTSRDSAEIGVLLTYEGKLDMERVTTQIDSLSQTVGVGGRSNILVIGDSCNINDSMVLEPTVNIEDGGMLEEMVEEVNNSVTKSSCFDFDESTGTITKYHQTDESCPTDIVIPESINGVPVRGIGERAFSTLENCYSPCDYPSPKSVSTNGSYQVVPLAMSCDTICNYSGNSTSVDFSKATSLEFIGDNAFSYNSLGNVKFGLLKSLTYIGERAFYDNDISILNLSTLPNLGYIGVEAFGSNSISTLNLRNLKKVVSIDYGAFSENNISIVNFSDLESLTMLGARAFADNNISSIDLNQLKNLTAINYETFNNNKIASVTLSNLPKLQRVDSNAFSSSYLTSVTFSNLENLTTISSDFCWECPLNNIVIKDNPKLTTIGEYAFFSNSYYDTNLVLENLPNLTSIGKNAFAHKRIDTLDLNKIPSYTIVDDYAFAELRMKKLIIGDYVTAIGISSFARTDITEVTIPSNVTSIGASAFYQNSLLTVTLEHGVTSIGNKAFGMGGANTGNSNYRLATIYNDTGVAFNWTNILNVSGNYEFVFGTIPYGNRNIEITSKK